MNQQRGWGYIERAYLADLKKLREQVDQQQYCYVTNVLEIAFGDVSTLKAFKHMAEHHDDLRAAKLLLVQVEYLVEAKTFLRRVDEQYGTRFIRTDEDDRITNLALAHARETVARVEAKHQTEAAA